MEFVSDERIRAIPELVEALFKNVLPDEESLFISDEATIFDVALSDTDELIRRCSVYYCTVVTASELSLPLWQLLPMLESRRLQQ